MRLLMEIRNYLKNPTSSTEGDIDMSIKQLESMEDAEEFEHELATPSIRKEVTENLARIGGTSLKNISNVMMKMMKKNVMCMFNMHGQRGKTPFKNTTMCSVITDSVMKKFRDASITEIQQIIGTKLRNAPKMNS